LTVTDRFWPTVGWRLLKPSAIKGIFLGRPSSSTALNLQPPSRRAEFPGALAPPKLRAEPATRCGEPASFTSVANRDWIRSPVHSAGPSSLSPRPNRPPRAAMDSSGCGARAYMLGARFGERAAEDGHLTLLSAHGCMRLYGAWVHGMSGCCWLLLLPPLPPTQCVLMPQGTAGTVR
jgi:hypothetical protein